MIEARAEIARLQARRMGPTEIARTLNANGIPAPLGRTRWRSDTVQLVALAPHAAPSRRTVGDVEPDLRHVLADELARYDVTTTTNPRTAPPCVIIDGPHPDDRLTVRVVARPGDDDWVRERAAKVMAVLVKRCCVPVTDDHGRPTLVMHLPVAQVQR